MGKIIRRADKILAYCRGTSYEKFAADAILAEACVFNLSQIGGLASRLDGALTLPTQQYRGAASTVCETVSSTTTTAP